MLLVLTLAGVVLGCAALIRRAIPIAVAVGVGALCWRLFGDPWTTCAASALAVVVSAGVIDAMASSRAPVLRQVVVGGEIAAAILIAGWLVFTLLRDVTTPAVLALSMMIAALFGVGLVMCRRSVLH